MLKETVDCTFSRTGLRGRIVGEVTLKLAAAYAHSPMPCEVEFSLTRRGGGTFREVQCNPRSAEVVGGGTKLTNVPHANIRCRMSLDSTAPILARGPVTGERPARGCGTASWTSCSPPSLAQARSTLEGIDRRVAPSIDRPIDC